MKVAILGLASRAQSLRVVELYKSYMDSLRGVYDENYGLISKSKQLEKIMDSLAKYGIIIVVVATGGSRGNILKLGSLEKYLILISHNTQNSLASTLHAKYILKKRGNRKVMHLHGSPAIIKKEAISIIKAIKGVEALRNEKVLLVGVEQDYLKDEEYDLDSLENIFGLTVDTLSLDKFLEEYKSKKTIRELPKDLLRLKRTKINEIDILNAVKLYEALRRLSRKHRGLGIRCFPILTKIKVTPCVAVAKLIDAGKIAACEADLSSLVTMLFVKAVTGNKSFMANVEDIVDNKMIVAHCTIAFSLTKTSILTTHFETGYGVAIQGKLERGEVTLVKISPDFKKILLMEGIIERGENFSDEFCRTQAIIQVQGEPERFLIGDFAHHIIMVYGRHKELLKKIAEMMGLDVVDV